MLSANGQQSEIVWQPADCPLGNLAPGPSSRTWRGIGLDGRIEGLSAEVETLARQDKRRERLMTLPGIGPIISSATIIAAIGTGDAFSKGRDFGAWLGLVPRLLERRPDDLRLSTFSVHHSWFNDE